MAEQSTPQKLYERVLRQRIEHTDMGDASRVALTNDDIANLALICDFPCVVYGYAVGAPSGYSFPITKGAALQAGVLLKQAADTAILLDENTDPNPRIDVIYIKEPTEDLSDNHNPRVLSALTRETATALSIGTGDGSTKIFSLAHPNVDPRTLLIDVGITPTGDWSFRKGTGPFGVDEIIFGEAPASGSITATYKWINGGVEATATNQPSRKTRRPNILATKGTPGASPVPTLPISTDAVILAYVAIPGSWVGGSGGVIIENSSKDFLVAPDSENVATTPGPLRITSRPGGLAAAIRGIDQVRSGMRLLYSDTDKIQITPGWGVVGGVAYTIPYTTEFTIAVGTTGWHYIYLDIDGSTTGLPGSPVSAIFVSQQAPDAFGQETNETYHAPYIGAVYLTGTGPTVIRPFYTHGDWVMWAAPSTVDSFDDGTETAGSYDLTIDDWVPATGRMAYVQSWAIASSVSAGSLFELKTQSHKESSALGTKPDFRVIHSITVGSQSVRGSSNGWVRAEDDAGTRKISYTISVSGTVTYSGDFEVLGYKDDYRTLDDTAAPSSY